MPTDLRAKVNKALEALGAKNGTAPPMGANGQPSQDPLDGAAHEYYVAQMGASYFDKRKKEAKETLMDGLSPSNVLKLKKVKDQVSEQEVKQDIEIGRTENYIILAEIKTGASYLNEAILRVAMKRKFKTEEIDELFRVATQRREPSITVKIVEND